MGEARKRRTAGDGEGELPDFIFMRDRAREASGGFLLAGTLVTDFPRREGARLSEAETRELEAVIKRVLAETRRDPERRQVSMWRGAMPADAIITDDLLRRRVASSVLIEVRIDPRGDPDVLRFSQDELFPDEGAGHA